MVKDLKKVMKELDKEWGNAEVQEISGGFVKIPDGSYVARLLNASVQLSKQSERLQIAWSLKIAEGEYAGKTLMKFDGLDHETSMSWVKGVMRLLGIDIPTSIAKLPASFEKFFEENDKVMVHCSVVTKDEYTNVYINGIADSDNTTAEDEENTKEEKPKTTTDGSKANKIKGMTMKELRRYINDNDLSIDPDDYDSTGMLRMAVLEEIS